MSQRLFIVSPMPPVRSGIADYMLTLLPHISRDWDVDIHVVVDQESCAEEVTGAGATVLRAEEFDSRTRRDDDVVWHQLANNKHHAFVLDRALSEPGVASVHDANFHHLVGDLLLRARRWDEYSEVLSMNHGERGVRVAHRRRNNIWTGRERFVYPVLRPYLDRCERIVVHNRWAQRQVARYVSCPVRIAPLCIAAPEPDADFDVRTTLRLADDAVIVAALGYLTEPKQPDVLLEAMGVLAGSCNAHFVVAGTVGDEYTFRRLAYENGVENRVHCLGYTSDGVLDAVASHADVIANLRYPTVGESSATLDRAVASHTPAVVLDHGSYSDYDIRSVYRIPLDADWVDAFVEAVLSIVAGKPLTVVQRGVGSVDEYVRRHRPAVTAALLRRLVFA